MEAFRSKLQELLKAIKSQARPMHPPLPKLPEIKPVATPSSGGSAGGGSKIPKMPGISPGDKKDPVKVAQQLKQGKTQKKVMPLLKVDKNGQWSI